MNKQPPEGEILPSAAAGAAGDGEARAGRHQQPHRRCPWERLENVEAPATLREGNVSPDRRLWQLVTVSLAAGLHTSLDTSPLSYRCCAALRIEPPTIQLFEHMCIFHSTNRKNKAAGLQGLDPRARMREAGEVFLWEISVVPPAVSLFPILFADCSELRPWGR